MKRILLAAGILSISLTGIGSAQESASAAGAAVHVTSAQMKQLARVAQTPEQYCTLEEYYTGLQRKYMREAAEEKQEWIRRSQNVMGVAAKYPRPVDSARYLYEYYIFKASENAALEAKYSRLAAPNAPVNAE